MLSTVPRTSRNRYESSGSAMDSATRGSSARLRNFCRVLVWVIRMCSPSQANHMTLDCGEPSGRTVARWAKVGFSSRSAWLSGGFTAPAWHARGRRAAAIVVAPATLRLGHRSDPTSRPDIDEIKCKDSQECAFLRHFDVMKENPCVA